LLLLDELHSTKFFSEHETFSTALHCSPDRGPPATSSFPCAPNSNEVDPPGEKRGREKEREKERDKREKREKKRERKREREEREEREEKREREREREREEREEEIGRERREREKREDRKLNREIEREREREGEREIAKKLKVYNYKLYKRFGARSKTLYIFLSFPLTLIKYAPSAYLTS
jgi:hypothetical protein